VEAERAAEDARAMFAEIVGASAEEVAIVPAVSTGAGIVAANMPPAQRGESIVVAENEFTSNYFPWVLLRERGYEVRAVPATGDGVSADAFAEVADGGTRLIAVSAVHSPTGYRTDLAALSQVAARSGPWLFVDACQAAGAVPLDVVRDGVDFLAASSHKFLLGARGMGYLALVAHRSEVRPFPLRHRSTIVSVPVDDTEAAMRRLRDANVIASVRAGRVRLSVHFYNLEAEIDRTAELLGRLP
jgi:selenocysteine lyase/cysteine desulfurase